MSVRRVPTAVALALVTAVAAALRLVDLGGNSFWIDELLSLCHAAGIDGLRSLLTPACGNAHPPLYFLLLKGWSVFGTGEFHLRLLSAGAGIAVIPLVYALGRDIAGEAAGLIASGLAAVSPFHLLYDRELRMYSLLTLLSVATLYYFLRAVRIGRARDWACFSVATILNLYVHYHALLVLLAEGILLLALFRRRDNWKPAALSLAAITAAYAVWVPVLVFQLRNPQMFTLDAPDKFPVVAGGWLARIAYLFYAFSLGQTLLPWRAFAVVGVCAFLVVAVLGVRRLRGRADALATVCVAVAVPVATGFALSQSMPRYYVFLAPLFYVVVAEGWLALPRHWWRAGAAALLLLPLAVSDVNYYRGRDFHILAQVDPWREVGSYLLGTARGGDCMVAIGSFRPLGYYTNDFAPFRRPIYGADFSDAETCLDGQAGRRVWVVTADPSLERLAEQALTWFEARYARVAERRFLLDPDYQMKARLLRKGFLEYRIGVYAYAKP